MRFSVSSSIAFAWALVLASIVGASTLTAQQSTVSAESPERVDRNAYRTLFRQAVFYKKLAEEASASQGSKPDQPDFKHLLAARFGLNEDDNATLERLSIAYQSEVDPIHKQIVQVIKTFHARFPDMTVRPGMDTSSPPELGSLQMQEDKVTLRYRDLLRNSMREDAYQSFHTRLLQEFGKTIKLN
jgi:hypothetical protein